jgi:hypothetical protein
MARALIDSIFAPGELSTFLAQSSRISDERVYAIFISDDPRVRNGDARFKERVQRARRIVEEQTSQRMPETIFRPALSDAFARRFSSEELSELRRLSKTPLIRKVIRESVSFSGDIDMARAITTAVAATPRAQRSILIDRIKAATADLPALPPSAQHSSDKDSEQ